VSQHRHIDESCLPVSSSVFAETSYGRSLFGLVFLFSQQRLWTNFLHVLVCVEQEPSICCSAICRIRYRVFVEVSQHRHMNEFCLQRSPSGFRENVMWTKLVWPRFLFSQQRLIDEFSSRPCLCLAGAHYIDMMQRHMQDPFSHICLIVTALSS